MAQTKMEEQGKEEEAQSCHDETKNIPKNYIKSIFALIQEDEEYMKKIFSKLKREGELSGQLE